MPETMFNYINKHFHSWTFSHYSKCLTSTILQQKYIDFTKFILDLMQICLMTYLFLRSNAYPCKKRLLKKFCFRESKKKICSCMSIKHINHTHLLIQTKVSVLNYHTRQQTDIKHNNNNDWLLELATIQKWTFF